MRACKRNALPVNVGQGSATRSEEEQIKAFHTQTTPRRVKTLSGTNDDIEAYVDSGDYKKLTILIGFIIFSISILI